MVDPERKKSFLAMHDQVSQGNPSDHKQNGHAYNGYNGEHHHEIEAETEGFELSDEVDHEILMHRDAHFGGDFGVMLNYYHNEENIGIHPELEIDRIEYLASVEKELNQDLAALMLTAPEAERVAKSRKMYADFKEIYGIEEEKRVNPKLISDLILSEIEEPEEEIEAVVARGEAIVDDLLMLLKSDDFYDPLFPGYGYAPYLAMICLGKIGDPKAIIPIFETLSKTIVFDDMVGVEALINIGDPAQKFLLKVLKGRPLTQDNPNAAFALISFSDSPEVATACFEELQKPDVQDKPLLVTYLLASCHYLDRSEKEEFRQMASDPATPAALREEMQQVIKEWE